MLKNIAQLEVKINERIHKFLTDHDAPLPEVKEALFQFLKYIGHIEDSVKEHQEKIKKEAEDKASEEPKTDEVKDV